MQCEVLSPGDGFIASMNTEDIGLASLMLGAGRNTLEDAIDYTAGIILKRKTGDAVRKGDPIAGFDTASENKIPAAEKTFLSALRISAEKPEEKPLVLDVVM